jgi:hypothetical protein
MDFDMTSWFDPNEYELQEIADVSLLSEYTQLMQDNGTPALPPSSDSAPASALDKGEGVVRRCSQPEWNKMGCDASHREIRLCTGSGDTRYVFHCTKCNAVWDELRVKFRGEDGDPKWRTSNVAVGDMPKRCGGYRHSKFTKQRGPPCGKLLKRQPGMSKETAICTCKMTTSCAVKLGPADNAKLFDLPPLSACPSANYDSTEETAQELLTAGCDTHQTEATQRVARFHNMGGKPPKVGLQCLKRQNMLVSDSEEESEVGTRPTKRVRFNLPSRDTECDSASVAMRPREPSGADALSGTALHDADGESSSMMSDQIRADSTLAPPRAAAAPDRRASSITLSGAGNPEVNGCFHARCSLPEDKTERPDEGFPLYQHETHSWLFIARFRQMWWIGHYQPGTRDFYCSYSAFKDPVDICTKSWVVVSGKAKSAEGKAPAPSIDNCLLRQADGGATERLGSHRTTGLRPTDPVPKRTAAAPSASKQQSPVQPRAGKKKKKSKPANCGFLKEYEPCDLGTACLLLAKVGTTYFSTHRCNPFQVGCDGPCGRFLHPCCSDKLKSLPVSKINETSFSFICEECV